MEKSVRLDLLEPVEQGSNIIDHLIIKQPKAKHLRKLPAGEQKTLGGMVDFAQALTDQPPSVFDELCLEDAVKVFEVIMNFLPDSLKTGSQA